MIYPTTEEEKRAFYAMALPGFLEYLRSHMSAIEQVELASTREGIVSFPATQILGGVQKTVRVPVGIRDPDLIVPQRSAAGEITGRFCAVRLQHLQQRLFAG